MLKLTIKNYQYPINKYNKNYDRSLYRQRHKMDSIIKIE